MHEGIIVCILSCMAKSELYCEMDLGYKARCMEIIIYSSQ